MSGDWSSYVCSSDLPPQTSTRPLLSLLAVISRLKPASYSNYPFHLKWRCVTAAPFKVERRTRIRRWPTRSELQLVLLFGLTSPSSSFFRRKVFSASGTDELRPQQHRNASQPTLCLFACSTRQLRENPPVLFSPFISSQAHFEALQRWRGLKAQ